MLSRAEKPCSWTHGVHLFEHMVCTCSDTETFTCTHHSFFCLQAKVETQAAELAALKQLQMQDMKAHQRLWEDRDALRGKLATSTEVHTALQGRVDNVEADAAAQASQTAVLQQHKNKQQQVVSLLEAKVADLFQQTAVLQQQNKQTEGKAAAQAGQVAALQQQNTLLEAAVKAQASQTAALQQQNALLTQQNEQLLQQMLLLQQWLSAAPRLRMPVPSPSPSAAPDVLNSVQPPVPSPGPKVHSEVALQLDPGPAPLLQANQQQIGLPSEVHSQAQLAATPSRAAELEAAVQPLQHSLAPQSDAAEAVSEAGQPSAALMLSPAAARPAPDEVKFLSHPVKLLPHELGTHQRAPSADLM